MVVAMIRLGTAVSCLCANKETDTAIVAGRNILKVFAISDVGFEEADSLRNRNQTSLNYSTNDIDWSLRDDNCFATAATNGAIVMWDINKMAKICSTSTHNFHTRTVNRVMFHPTEAMLLTGAQDGRVKFYDYRQQKVTSEIPGTCSVRDMRFNPNPLYFSTACDNGLVMIWDTRNLHRAETTITCHNGAVLSIDWHPDTGDGRHWLVTGGLRDNLVRVWHTSGSTFTCDIQARVASAVRKFRWRPERGSQQILTAHMMYPDLHVWDMSRPFVPRLSFEGHTEPVTGLLWREQTLFPRQFLSVGKDGMVFLRRIEESRQPAREINPMGLSFSGRGDLAMAYADGLIDSKRMEKVEFENCELNGGSTQDSITSPPPFPLDIRIWHHIQSDPVDVGVKVKPSSSNTRRYFDNKLPFSATSSRLVEFSLTSDCDGLGPDQFVTMARGYRLSGSSPDVLCDHNARLACQLGVPYVQAMWAMLQSMLCAPPTASAAPVPSQANTPSVEAPASLATDAAAIQHQDGSVFGGQQGTASDGAEMDEKERQDGDRDERGVYSRSGQETTTANSEDEADLLTDVDKFVATFANVEPIDFLFSDGREEVDLHDVFTAAQNDHWSEEMGHLPREAIQPYDEIDHLPVSEIGEAWEQNDFFGHEVDLERETFLEDVNSRHFNSGTNNSHTSSQRRLRPSGGMKQHSGREHGRRIGEMASTEHEKHSTWVAPALVDYSSRAQASQARGAVMLGLDYGPVIAEMLVDVVERLGDVQSACCAVIVMGEPLRSSVDFEKYGVWLLEYIDSLARFQLWCEMTQVIRLCGHPQVGIKNQEGTVINTKCSRCGKAVPPGGVCPKHVEKPPIACVVCHQAVRGLYMWCQGCGHGGHMQHIQEWLSNNSNCPAGCGHKCEYC